MGFEDQKKLLEWIRGNSELKDCLVEKNGPPPRNKPFAAFYDAPTRLFHVQSPNPDDPANMSGLELAESLLKEPLNLLCAGQAQVVGVFMDISELVPMRKRPEQMKRAESSEGAGNIPYPPGTSIRNEGVVLPAITEKQPDGTVTEIEPAKLELVNRDRFAISGLLRKPLMSEVICGNMPTLLLPKGLPAGKTLLLEFTSNGPVTVSGIEMKIHPNFTHNLGEFDKLAPYYARVYRHLPVEVVTADTDLILDLLQLVDSTENESDIENPRLPIYWHAPDQKRWIDIRKFYAGILQMGLTVKVLACALLLSGNDYMFKAHFSYFVPFYSEGKRAGPSVLSVVKKHADRIEKYQMDYESMLEEKSLIIPSKNFWDFEQIWERAWSLDAPPADTDSDGDWQMVNEEEDSSSSSFSSNLSLSPADSKTKSKAAQSAVDAQIISMAKKKVATLRRATSPEELCGALFAELQEVTRGKSTKELRSWEKDTNNRIDKHNATSQFKKPHVKLPEFQHRVRTFQWALQYVRVNWSVVKNLPLDVKRGVAYDEFMYRKNHGL